MGNVNAQNSENSYEFKIHQSLFRENKSLILLGFISNETDEEKAFWKLFEEYEKQRLEIADEQFELILRYIEEYNTLDDKSTEELFKKSVRLDKDHQKLKMKYYKKIKKSSGIKIAVQFVQAENYFGSRIRAHVFEEIPFLGEVDKLK